MVIHDNTPAHREKACDDYLTTTKLKLLDHPPYSPVIVLYVFVVVPRMKANLKGREFLLLLGPSDMLEQ